jgi:PAS domain S-box-containing protein
VAQDARDQLLDSLLQNAPLGIAVLDRDWRIARINASAAEILGGRPEDLVGQSLWDGAPKLAGTAYEQPCRTAMDEHAAQRFEEPASGPTRWEVHVTPAKEGLALWWFDLSERARVEDKTLRLRALAHDLRTPLTVIGLNAELLAATAARRGDDADRQKAEAVGRAAQQLSELAQHFSTTLREGTT